MILYQKFNYPKRTKEESDIVYKKISDNVYAAKAGNEVSRQKIFELMGNWYPPEHKMYDAVIDFFTYKTRNGTTQFQLTLESFNGHPHCFISYAMRIIKKKLYSKMRSIKDLAELNQCSLNSPTHNDDAKEEFIDQLHTYDNDNMFDGLIEIAKACKRLNRFKSKHRLGSIVFIRSFFGTTYKFFAKKRTSQKSIAILINKKIDLIREEKDIDCIDVVKKNYDYVYGLYEKRIGKYQENMEWISNAISVTDDILSEIVGLIVE